MKTVNIYIETSIKSPKRLNGKVGYILETDTAKGPATFTRIAPVQQMTAHLSEMEALRMALDHMKVPSHLVIFTDSRFLKSSIEWLPGWKENDWKKANGKEIANVAEWKLLDGLLQGHELEFRVGEDRGYKKWLTAEVSRME